MNSEKQQVDERCRDNKSITSDLFTLQLQKWRLYIVYTTPKPIKTRKWNTSTQSLVFPHVLKSIIFMRKKILESHEHVTLFTSSIKVLWRPNVVYIYISTHQQEVQLLSHTDYIYGIARHQVISSQEKQISSSRCNGRNNSTNKVTPRDLWWNVGTFNCWGWILWMYYLYGVRGWWICWSSKRLGQHKPYLFKFSNYFCHWRPVICFFFTTLQT